MSKSDQLIPAIGEETIKRVLNILRSSLPKDLVSGVIAPPGSGKSTTLAAGIQQGLKAIRESEGKSGPARIFITEPTIPATFGLYKYMSGLHKQINVGYAAESNIRYSESTEIVYCTGGHMENKMMSYFEGGETKSDLDFCDALILDEAHQGSLIYEVIIGLWLRAYQSGVKVPHLVFMSATLSVEDLGFKSIPLVKVLYKPFEVVESFVQKKYDLDDRHLYRDTAAIAMEKHLTRPVKAKGRETVISAKGEKREVDYPGYDVWIIFCPGQKEVLDVAHYLEVYYENALEDRKDTAEAKKIPELEVFPVYGKMGSDAYKGIFSPPPEGVRRIIPCTNVAEASITIEFVSFIFNTGTEKYTTSTPLGATCLTLGKISKASARQRAGRTGRLCPGECLHLMTKEEFDSLVEQRVPESKRVPLHNVVIKIKGLGLDPIKLFRDRIDATNLEVALSTLQFLGMIKDDEVTAMGYFAAILPISVYGAALLYSWCKLKYDLFVGIVLVSLIDSADEGYFIYNTKGMVGKERELAIQEQYDEKFAIFSAKTDLEAIILMWHHLVYHTHTLRPKYHVLSKWCMKHSLNRKKIAEALGTMARLCNIFTREREKELALGEGSSIQEIKMGSFSPLDAIQKVTPLLEKVYGERQCILRKEGKKLEYSCPRNRRSIHVLDTRSPMSPRDNVYTNIVAIKINTSSMEQKDGVRVGPSRIFISFFAPIKGDYLPNKEEIEYDTSEAPIKVEEDDEDQDIEEALPREERDAVSPLKRERKGFLIEPARARRRAAGPEFRPSKPVVPSKPAVKTTSKPAVSEEDAPVKSTRIVYRRDSSSSEEEDDEPPARRRNSSVSTSEEKPARQSKKETSKSKKVTTKKKKISSDEEDDPPARITPRTKSILKKPLAKASKPAKKASSEEEEEEEVITPKTRSKASKPAKKASSEEEEEQAPRARSKASKLAKEASSEEEEEVITPKTRSKARRNSEDGSVGAEIKVVPRRMSTLPASKTATVSRAVPARKTRVQVASSESEESEEEVVRPVVPRKKYS